MAKYAHDYELETFTATIDLATEADLKDLCKQEIEIACENAGDLDGFKADLTGEVQMLHAYDDLADAASGPMVDQDLNDGRGSGFDYDTLNDARVSYQGQAQNMTHADAQYQLNGMDRQVDAGLDLLNDAGVDYSDKLETIKQLYGDKDNTGVMSNTDLLVQEHEKVHDHDKDLQQGIEVSMDIEDDMDR